MAKAWTTLRTVSSRSPWRAMEPSTTRAQTLHDDVSPIGQGILSQYHKLHTTMTARTQEVPVTKSMLYNLGSLSIVFLLLTVDDLGRTLVSSGAASSASEPALGGSQDRVERLSPRLQALFDRRPVFRFERARKRSRDGERLSRLRETSS